MNPFDSEILSFLNSFAQHSRIFDTFISGVLDNVLIKGGIITALLWWAWFGTGDDDEKRHEFLLSGIITSFLAILAGRTLQLFLPFRERPLRNVALHFRIPYGVDQNMLAGWSSFPSDHAVLFFALATSIFFASRRIGILAFLHAIFIVSFTRVYLGLHYPTDILAGAFLGIAFASLSRIALFRENTTRYGIRWLRSHPASFYASFFLVTSQISVLFDPLRELIQFALVFGKALLKP